MGSRNPPARRGVITKTVKEIVADVHHDMQVLKDELIEWKDFLLDGDKKFKEIEEAVSAIDAADEAEVPTCFEAVSVSWAQPVKRRKSRADRRDDCTVALLAACAALEDHPMAHLNKEFINELQQLVADYEAVGFPGMN